MELRICKECKQEKNIGEFERVGTIKGVIYRRYRCKVCDYPRKQLNRKKRLQWFKDYKKTLKCARCGIDDHRVLQFHHINKEDKEFGVANIVNHSKKRLLHEISKCEVLCANCHAIEHYTEVA